MYKVKIPSGNFHLERQLPRECHYIWNNCEFIFDDTTSYDYFVTLDNLPKDTLCHVDRNHRLLFLGEPPFIRQYNKKFIQQYGHIYTCQEKKVLKGEAKKTFPILPWMIGISFKENSHTSINSLPFLTYDDFSSMEFNAKRKNKACLITSKKIITKGHRERVKFADYVLDHCSDIIDVYGNGYKSIPDKFDVLREYKYAIIIENCRYPDYWTEKLGDCFLGGCYPIYHGCPNIDQYFPHESFKIININERIKTLETIRKTVLSGAFEKSNKFLEQSKRLVLDKYNIFPQIVFEINKIENCQNHYKQLTNNIEIIHPLKLSLIDKIKMKLIRKYNLGINI